MTDQMRRIDAQAFSEALMAALPSDTFSGWPILRHVAALASFRAAQRLSVLPPRVPEHVTSAIVEAFRNTALTSHIPEVRAGVSFLSVGPARDVLDAAVLKVWPEFFQP